jgi:hypothetical protein
MVWDDQQVKEYLFNDRNLERYNASGGDKLRMLFNNFDRKINSWAILWDFCHFMNDGYCLYPSRSFASNIGLDHSGTHTKRLPEYEVSLSDWPFDSESLPESPHLNPVVSKVFRNINRKFYRDILDYFRIRRFKKDTRNKS